MDGGSTDGSLEIIKKYQDKLTHWESAPDQGLYDAIDRGFKYCTGEIMGWINSDDLLLPKSLFTVGGVFHDLPAVEWFQGWPTTIDELGRLIENHPPTASRWSLLSRGYRDGLGFIQQESTYWRRSLWEKAGGCLSCDHSLAADFELWMRFFEHADLYTTRALVGGFRIRRSGQSSIERRSQYLQQADEVVTEHLTKLDSAERRKLLLWRFLGHRAWDAPLLRSLKTRLGAHLSHSPKNIKFDHLRSVFYLSS